MAGSAVTEQIRESIRQNLTVLNRLDPHLGCALCHGPLTDGRCPECQPVYIAREDET